MGGYKVSPAGGAAAWAATLAADAQQDTMAQVDVTAPSGAPSGSTYQWALYDPTGTDRVALFTGSDTDADPGAWTPDWTGGSGVWIEECAITSGGVTNTYRRRVQIGDDARWVLQDLSTATETDGSSVSGGSTSLGTTSTLEAADQHGWNLDSGMDGASWSINQGAYPTGYQFMSVRVDCATLPSSGPTNGVSILGVGISPDATPANLEGLTEYVKCNSTPSIRMLDSGLPHWGSSETGNVDITGALELKMTVSLGASAPDVAISHGKGSTSGRQANASDGAVAVSGTWTNIWSVVHIGNDDASPGAATSWGGVKHWVKFHN